MVSSSEKTILGYERQEGTSHWKIRGRAIVGGGTVSAKALRLGAFEEQKHGGVMKSKDSRAVLDGVGVRERHSGQIMEGLTRLRHLRYFLVTVESKGVT